MNRTTIIVTVGLAFAATLTAHPAEAQNPRSFVSGQGVDGNACTLAAPCRTFAAAILKTNAGGEIITLNPAGYGGLTIDKSISIVSSLGVGGVNMLQAGAAITINAGVNDIVSLRGLTIDGLGLGSTGIQFNTGQSLTIANCVVRGLTVDGILFQPNASSSLAVSNTLLADNGARGFRVIPTGAGTVKASFNRVEIYNNSLQGLNVNGAGSTGTVNVVVTDSVVANNGTGLFVVSANATLRIGQSTLTGNINSWSVVSGAILRSYGDNNIDGNGDGDPAPTIIAKK